MPDIPGLCFGIIVSTETCRWWSTLQTPNIPITQPKLNEKEKAAYKSHNGAFGVSDKEVSWGLLDSVISKGGPAIFGLDLDKFDTSCNISFFEEIIAFTIDCPRFNL